jgi:hypothetical protein
MKQIKELAKFVTENREKKIDLIDWDVPESDDNYRKTTELAAKNKVNTEEDISAIIDAPLGSPKFRKFKSRLKEKLLNNVLFFDIKEEDKTPYHRALMLCGRNVYCIKVFTTIGLAKSAERLARSTLKKAVEFELYESAFYCARELRRLYSYSGNEEEFNKYNQDAEEYARLNACENRANACLESLYVKVANTNFFKKELNDLAKIKLEEVTKIHEEAKTYLTGLFYYRVKVIYEELYEDYHAALKTWESFDKYIEGYKNYEYNIRMAEMAVQQFYCYLCLEDYEASQKSAVKCEMYYKPPAQNWLLYKEYYFLLAMHTRKYNQATATIQQIIAMPSFRFLSDNRQEKWRLFEAYNFIMQKASGVDTDTNPQFNKFKLTKFLNETPIYNKDKEGFNISILVVQVMTFLLDKKFEELAEKVDALKRYVSRTFQKDTEYKSQIFIKMIILADKNNYDYNKTTSATEDLFADLKIKKYKHSNSYEGLEIVPYAHLWEVVLDCIK